MVDLFRPNRISADNFQQDVWVAYGSHIDWYVADFSARGAQIGLVGDHLRHLATKSVPVIIDLMAPTSALVSLSQKLERPIRALAVSLRDAAELYEEDEFDELTREDLNAGVVHLTGDIEDEKTWRQIENWRGNEGVDLIMERAYGGFKQISVTRSFFCKSARRMWEMLGLGGMLWLQTPPLSVMERIDIPAEAWFKKMEDAKVAFSFRELENVLGEFGYLLIRKDSAHQDLPKV